MKDRFKKNHSMTGFCRQWIIAVLFTAFVCGCGEGDNIVKKKLDIILTEDLQAIVEGLPKSCLADSLYYSIVSYKPYKEGMYSKMAVVDFYFYKKIKVKITRKYRYYTGARLWDRYSNAYVFIEDSLRTR
jgi:hypothetical protein